MGKRTNPGGMLIKAELCQAELINKGPQIPQTGIVQDQTASPYPWLRGTRDPV